VSLVEDAWRTLQHLMDNVFPIVPVRQWVLSLPFALRYRMAYDANLTSDVLNVFIRALFRELERCASELLRVRSSQCGAVTFCATLRRCLECQSPLSLPGDTRAFTRQRRRPEFQELPAPEDEDVLRLNARESEDPIAIGATRFWN
jgi:hypothetical protein